MATCSWGRRPCLPVSPCRPLSCDNAQPCMGGLHSSITCALRYQCFCEPCVQAFHEAPPLLHRRPLDQHIAVFRQAHQLCSFAILLAPARRGDGHVQGGALVWEAACALAERALHCPAALLQPRDEPVRRLPRLSEDLCDEGAAHVQLLGAGEELALLKSPGSLQLLQGLAALRREVPAEALLRGAHVLDEARPLLGHGLERRLRVCQQALVRRHLADERVQLLVQRPELPQEPSLQLRRPLCRDRRGPRH
mmetsp:Transcript_92113/g.298217  ORF Transcript_92113/g.298217 Transcript_92113/m.298217 type:complete len:251 (+) Transcript_92113:1306-2058(+)